MIRLDQNKAQWIDTEDPEWTHHMREEGGAPSSIKYLPLFFPDRRAFYDWLNGHSLEFTTIVFVSSSDTPWYVHLTPISTDTFSWGLPIAGGSKNWYEAYQYAVAIDEYFNLSVKDIVDESQENS